MCTLVIKGLLRKKVLATIQLTFDAQVPEKFLHRHLMTSVNFEMSIWGLQISQKTNKIFVRISALAS